MVNYLLRSMAREDWDEVAELIAGSTNRWYEKQGRPAVFPGGSETTRLFCEVYESLDPGCCIVAEADGSGRLIGSGFYHPRETHVALGIMNVHPDCFGMGIARKILNEIVGLAESAGKPVRLVSSALNLDSFSLYSRAGFVVRRVFQDLCVSVPAEGLRRSVPGLSRVRDATPNDVAAIGELEMAISHIRREKDFHHFVRNDEGVWHLSVFEDHSGEIAGALASVKHSGFSLLGPGFARTEEQAVALVFKELDAHRGCSPVCLVPTDCPKLVHALYRLGARNCELHFAQVLGHFKPYQGVVISTFMPETG